MGVLGLLLLAMIGGGLCFASLRNWRFGFFGLLIFLPFAGFLSLRSGQSAFALLAKDFIFVIPAYISFFVMHRYPIVRTRIPGLYVGAMIALAIIVALQAFNPNIPNPLVALIGIKVWLLYMPLTFMAAATVNSTEDVVRLLRVLVVVSIVPFAVAFLQRFGIAVVGQEATAAALYGSSFDTAQYGALVGVNDFSNEDGGGLYRLSGTFSANGQFGIYALAMVSIALALSMIESHRKWKRFAQVMMLTAIVASFASGSKGATLFVPMAVVPALLLSRNVTALLVWGAIISAAYVAVLVASQVDVWTLVAYVWDYSFYNLQDFGTNQFLQTFIDFPLGIGAGMTTGGARYAFSNQDTVYESIYFFEVYYAKVVVELSFVGLLPVIILMFAPLIYSVRCALSHPSNEVRMLASALSGFFLVVCVMSYKAWPLDVDPDNVMYWVLVGMLYKFSALAYGVIGKRMQLPRTMRPMIAIPKAAE